MNNVPIILHSGMLHFWYTINKAVQFSSLGHALAVYPCRRFTCLLIFKRYVYFDTPSFPYNLASWGVIFSVALYLLFRLVWRQGKCVNLILMTRVNHTSRSLFLTQRYLNVKLLNVIRFFPTPVWCLLKYLPHLRCPPIGEWGRVKRQLLVVVHQTIGDAYD